MQSKLLINILGLIALIGLTGFALVKLTSNDINDVSQNKTKEIAKFTTNSLGLEQSIELLENNLTALKEKKGLLELRISENEESSNQLREIILLLGEKRKVLSSEIVMLERKKTTLGALVSDLATQSDNSKKVASNKVIIKLNEVNDSKKLLVNLNELKAENESLKQQIITNKDMFDLKIADDREAVQELKSELRETGSRALEKQDVLDIEIEQLSDQVQVLIEENKRNLDLALDEKRQLLAGFKLDIDSLKANKQTQSEIDDLKNLKSNFEKLNGLRVIFSGNMIYDESSSQIVFQAENSIGIPIFQDDFTGSIAGKCGLPIDEEIENRCSATIIAEFVVEKSGLFLRGKEIVEIVRK